MTKFDQIMGNISINNYRIYEELSDTLSENEEYIDKAKIIDADLTDTYELIMHDLKSYTFDNNKFITEEQMNVVTTDFIQAIIYYTYDIIENSTIEYIDEDENFHLGLINVYGVENDTLISIEKHLCENIANGRYNDLRITLQLACKDINTLETFYHIPYNFIYINNRYIFKIMTLYGTV